MRVLAELMAGTRGAVASLPREAEELLTEVADDRLGLVPRHGASLRRRRADSTSRRRRRLSPTSSRARGLASRLALVHANDSASSAAPAATVTPTSATGRSASKGGGRSSTIR